MRLFLIAAPALALTATVHAEVPDTTSTVERQTPQIDYSGFAALTAEVAALRQQRLLAKDEFFRGAAAEGALLLDTRSAAAFEAGHIEGAINLPFSDFTADKLRDAIGEDPNRAIYIYCNNNFSDNAFPIALKSAPLALNIPTFINLVGYGYENVWELDGVMPISEVAWTGKPLFAQLEAAQLEAQR